MIKMITVENLKKVLDRLGYSKIKNGDVYSKNYAEFDCCISIDFANKKIVYPKEKGMKIHRETTCNFSEPENFVVLECITSLMDKGYRPENIELEKPMPGGHKDNGGFCDIQVKDNTGRTFLLIECKRADEFDRYWKKTMADGGQLFRYFNSYRQAQALCLYMSDFINGDIKRMMNIISMLDNKQLLETDKKLKSFKQVQMDNGDKEDYFVVWKDTYQQDFENHGIFEKEIELYSVGKQKYNINNLDEITHDSMQKKYHEFASILRQHNVGSHENAFDKLINLFLAKIVDETVNSEELLFRWKGAAYDDYFSLQDRLQKLYKEGMEKFIGEEVTYIDQKEVKSAFHLFKNDPDATRDKVLEYFRQMKFYTNSDFAFLDVHNEELFYKNSEILKRMVKMLEDIILKTKEPNQFLGDLFEGFLDDGVKQSEGQFFTPIPIVKFIISSLPLAEIYDKCEEIPCAIDYACGAGHFLNELAQEIKEIVNLETESEIHEYYKRIVGIEKDYRLSKVAKVSAFMYGQPDIQILYADALANNEKIRENSFNILVANPPYSVKGFLETLSEEDRKKYTLYKQVPDISTNRSIETFFIERANQLLKPEGIGAIIVPISVLNKGNIYAGCREIILGNFQIVAIVELGTGTFGKTGQNTATLFLKKRNMNPDMAVHNKNRVEAWFDLDASKDIVFDDVDDLKRYCIHCGFKYEEYQEWLKGGVTPNNSLFEEYVKKAKSSQKYKNIDKKKISAKYSEKAKKNDLSDCIFTHIKTIEKEKLFYYLMAVTNEYPVLIIQSPIENTAEKEFLGYEWSGAKGNEGIKYLGNEVEDEDDTISKNQGIHNIKTPMFDPSDFENTKKLNYYIRKNFQKEKTYIPEELSTFAKYSRLEDMLDFSNTEFDKVIRTNATNSYLDVNKYKYEVSRVNDLLKKVNGSTIKIDANQIKSDGKYPVVTQAKDEMISGYIDSDEVINDLPLVVFGDHSCTFKYLDRNFVRGADGTQLMKFDSEKCNAKYAFYYLSNIEIPNAGKYERHYKYVKNLMIPLPPLSIQKEIVHECEKYDKEIMKIQNANISLQKRTKEIIDAIFSKGYEEKRIQDVSRNTQYGTSKKSKKEGTVAVIRMGNIQNGKIDWSDLVYTDNEDDINKYELKKNDVLFNRTNSPIHVGKTGIYKGEQRAIFAGYLIRINYIAEMIDPDYLCYVMNSEKIRNYGFSVMKKSINQANISGELLKQYRIPVPSMAEQKQIVAEIGKIEREIDEGYSKIESLKALKKKYIKKELFN